MFYVNLFKYSSLSQTGAGQWPEPDGAVPFSCQVWPEAQLQQQPSRLDQAVGLVHLST